MTGHLSIGDLQVHIVSGGSLRIDGGNMFGVIPRVLWERQAPPDDLNRIPLDTNCLLIRTPDSLGLIDTGYGSKAPPRFRKRFALPETAPLVDNLLSCGVTPEQIDWVILTHLHFDHAGGCTFRDDKGRLQPTFPRARHLVQQREWDDALSGRAELAGAYHPDDLTPLEEAHLITCVDGAAEIVPGISVELSGGHTRGHQIVSLQSGNESAVCPVDLCPTSAHLRTFWTMAYDQFPLEVRRVKREVLQDIADHNRLLLFAHDVTTPAVRLISIQQDEWKAVPVNKGDG